MWVPAAHTEQELGNDVSNSKKIPYKDNKKKLHLLILISNFYVSLWFGYFWDTLEVCTWKYLYPESMLQCCQKMS